MRWSSRWLLETQRGFSTFESLMPLSVAAALALAAPVLRHLASDSDRAGTVNAVLIGLRSARQLAEETGKTVTVCPAAAQDARRCGDPADWSHGLVAFVDLDRDGRQGAREAVLWSRVPDAAGLRVTSDQPSFSFSPFYVRQRDAPNTEGRITVCDPRDPAGARTIEVGPRRRAQLSDTVSPPDACVDG